MKTDNYHFLSDSEEALNRGYSIAVHPSSPRRDTCFIVSSNRVNNPKMTQIQAYGDGQADLEAFLLTLLERSLEPLWCRPSRTRRPLRT